MTLTVEQHLPATGRGWFDVRRQWWVLLGCVASAVALSWLYTVNATPLYQSSTQVLFSARPIVTDSEPAAEARADVLETLARVTTFSRDKVPTYAQLVTSTQVLGPVMRSAGVTGTEDNLRGRVSVIADTDTGTLLITVRDGDPVRAAQTCAAIAARLPEVVAALEMAEAGDESPVRALVIREATPAGLPFWPRMDFNLSVGLVAGLVVGIGLATMRDQLDTRIRGEQQLFEVALATPLAVLPHVRRTSRPGGPVALRQEQAVTRLRVNLGFGSSRGGPRTLLVTSATAKQGRTAVARLLAESSAWSGLRVLLVDCQLTSSGGAGGPLDAPGVSDVVAGLLDPADVIRVGPQGLSLVGAGRRPPNPAEILGSRPMADLVTHWREQFDLVVLDGAGLVGIADALVLVPHVDGVLCVVEDGVTRRPQLAEALALVEAVRGRTAGVVLTGVRRAGPQMSIRGSSAPARQEASTR